MSSQVLSLLKSTFPALLGLLACMKGACSYSGLPLPRHCDTSHNITCLGLFPSSWHPSEQFKDGRPLLTMRKEAQESRVAGGVSQGLVLIQPGLAPRFDFSP